MLRRALPLLAASLVLIGVAVGARDTRAALLAFVVLAVLLTLLLRRTPESGEVPYPRPSAHPVTVTDGVVDRLTGAFLAVAAVVGALLGWFSAGNPVAVVGGALMGAFAALILAGLSAALVSLGAELVRRLRGSGSRVRAPQ